MLERFDGFYRRITQQLEGIQSPNIIGVQAELVELRKLVYEIHDRPILLMPIVEETYKEDMVEYIWVINDVTPTCCDGNKGK